MLRSRVMKASLGMKDSTVSSCSGCLPSILMRTVRSHVQLDSAIDRFSIDSRNCHGRVIMSSSAFTFDDDDCLIRHCGSSEVVAHSDLCEAEEHVQLGDGAEGGNQCRLPAYEATQTDSVMR